MANKQQEEERTSIDEINDTLTGVGEKVQRNSKAIVTACIAVVVVVAAVLVYIYAIRQPGISKANDAIGQADLTMLMGNDSLALAQYKTVADDYGYAAGNRAALNAAIVLYQQEKYQEALDYLNRYSAKEPIIGAAAYSLKGDCYVNLEQYDNAVDAFKKAIAQSDDNPSYTPYFMMKEATVLRAMGNYKAEAEIYRQIIDQYPHYGSQTRTDMEKYLRRAELQAGEKAE